MKQPSGWKVTDQTGVITFPSRPDFDALGHAAIDAIIEGGMITLETLEDGSFLFNWNGNAAEQIGEALRREVARQHGAH